MIVIEMAMSAQPFLKAVTKFFSLKEGSLDKYLKELVELPRWGGGTVEPAVAQLLYVLVRMREPSLLLEYGTNVGYSTYFIAEAIERNDHGEFITIEINKVYMKEAQFNILQNKPSLLGKIAFICASSTDESMENFIRNNRDYIDMFFLDSSHEYFDTVSELRTIFQHCKRGTIVMMHDIYSDGVKEALKSFNFTKFLEVPTQPNTGFGIGIL